MAPPEDHPAKGSVAECLLKAEEAEKRAEVTVSDDAKLMMLEVAAQWRALAHLREGNKGKVAP